MYTMIFYNISSLKFKVLITILVAMNVNFSRAEIERLFELRDIIGALHEATGLELRKNTNPTREMIKDEMAKVNVGQVIFQTLFDTYKFQIYHVIAADNWQERINPWLDLMVTDPDPGMNRLACLNRIYRFINDFLPVEQPIGVEATYRMHQNILSEFGYEKGYGVLAEIYKTEPNAIPKNELQQFVENNEKFAPFKQVLGSLTLAENFRENLQNWSDNAVKDGLTKPDIYNLLSQFCIYLQYHPETSGKPHLPEIVIDFLDEFREAPDTNSD